MKEDSTADNSGLGCYEYSCVYSQCPYALPCGKKPCEMGDKKCPAEGGYHITWNGGDDPFNIIQHHITICTNNP